ncbi:MAG: peptidoglycan DD-metalloendopeptidase family protein [Acidiferrobacteraceae bacterium]
MTDGATSGGKQATRKRIYTGLVALLWIIVSTAGCARDVSAPIDARPTFLPAARTRYWIVSRGDTLYSIAWAAGLDYRVLARWNGIHRPFVIQAGARLRLFGPPVRYQRSRPSGRAVLYRRPRPRPVRPQTLSLANRPLHWVWPVVGPLLRGYQQHGSKGIDIGGSLGSAVRAAAAGEVVYTGSGLPGYGKLIILKHNKNFLSAYAHNSRILVKEGEMVRRGQEIAEMGSSGADRVMLHFEIRLRGNPVDPLRYLPRTP